MKRYRTEKYNTVITEIEVIRETGKTVVYVRPQFRIGGPVENIEVKERKESEYHVWHDTWDAAYDYLLTRVGKRVEYIRVNLDEAERDLAKLKGMKPDAVLPEGDSR